ncbi:MAG: transcription termination factor NusA [Dehalococcoidia bacterium]|nr:MAG: transcription termination/antitermination protein NusA [bacterium]MCK6565618.1 transcription termination factor NusA [Dehalococcoidia bacterium]MCL4230828.1 transcription termination/antitermination protein NusA [Dehalococcoidia bacterium]RIL04125.1 MAG: transcription termination/antitermination protein NusA [bacterium]
MKNEFLLAIGQLAAEKNLPKEIVFEAVEAALTSAYRREGENAPNIYAKIDAESGDIHAYMQKTVVEEVEEPNIEIALTEARRYKASVAPGDVLDFEIKIPDHAGRIAAQTAKQVVLQRLREAERDAVFDEYAGRENEVVIGTVQRIEPRQIILELGRGTEAVLPFSEQVRNEHLRSGQRVKVLLLEVQKAVKGPQIIVSRTHRNLLRRLFETEVPEIASGTVEIKSIARDGGYRSKVAVHSRVPSIDPIGACVGMRGSRIQNIVNELGGERIDVIKWDPDAANFVSNALSPAQVVDVEVDPEERRATLVVPDRMLSLAIGKEGQNARLAAKLTGWRIDILSQSAAEARARGEEEQPSSFEAFAPGEVPDIDIIHEVEEAVVEVAEEPVHVAPPIAPPAQAEVVEEEVTSFADALAGMPIPRGEERESEDYGDEYEEEEEEEEYEVPTMVAPEARPTTIRFAEDVLPKVAEETPEAKKASTKKVKRAARFEEEEEMEDVDYSGRIH